MFLTWASLASPHAGESGRSSRTCVPNGGAERGAAACGGRRAGPQALQLFDDDARDDAHPPPAELAHHLEGAGPVDHHDAAPQAAAERGVDGGGAELVRRLNLCSLRGESDRLTP